MRSLITGGRGFVGVHLAEHLRARGDEVTQVDAECDVTIPEQIASTLLHAQPEAIYHLAARSSVAESFADPVAYTRVNVVGTANLLKVASEVAPRARVLVVSSSDVYGGARPGEGPVSETRFVDPVSPYAQSKLEAEAFARRAAHEGQDVVIVRPFPHLGPGQSTRFVVPALVERLLDARRHSQHEVPVGDLSVRRDYCDVRDVVRAYRLLVEHAPRAQTYNVASSHDVALSDIADQLAELVGVSVRWRVEESLLRPADVSALRGDVTRLHEVTGWEPRIGLRTSLLDVIDDVRTRREND